MDIRLDGHCALVAGAARNIGRSIALALASSGSYVICAYQSGRDDAEKVVAELKAAGSTLRRLDGDAVARGPSRTNQVAQVCFEVAAFQAKLAGQQETQSA